MSTIDTLQESSRMAAKVDNNCLQDSYTLYHHAFVVTEDGGWCVVQQGMNDGQGDARRYHWLSDSVEQFVEEPQEAVCCNEEREALDMTASSSDKVRQVSLDLVNDGPRRLRKYVKPRGQASLASFTDGAQHLEMPRHHWITESDLSERTMQQLERAYELQPSEYKELVGMEGIGKKSLRALALIAELVHGDKASWKDPVKYSYAHGGKDGTPYPVDREAYDESIENMREMLAGADVDREEKKDAFERLEAFMRE